MDRFGRSTLWLTLMIIGLVFTVGVVGMRTGSPQVQSGGSPVVAAASGEEVIVEMNMFRFGPDEIRVAPGTTIRFVNTDAVVHNVVHARPETLGKEPELFRSPDISPNGSWTVTLTEEGTYPILCDLGGHYMAGMVGTITVTPDVDAVEDVAAEAAPRISRAAWDMPGPLNRDHSEHVVVELETIELVGQLADGLTYTYWTFNGTVPGPMIRVRQGDTVELRLSNNESSTQSHSIDLHAVTGPGGGAAVTQVAPGETKSFEFKALSPGVYVYHCATPHIPTHIALGMYGLIVVEPPGGFNPVDHEFYIMQGDIYADLRPGAKGHADHDPSAMWDEQPNFVVFNGQYQALTGDHAMKVNVGDTVRLFIGNGGPNLTSSFHIIGEIFDEVHPDGATEALTNVQTTVIAAGGATWVEFTVDVPGEYTLVDHALSRALDKGAIGIIEAVGPEVPDIFRALD